MNTINKILIAGLLSLSMLTAVAQEQPSAGAEPQHEGCPMHQLAPSMDFVSVKTCYAPQLQAFVAVDSVDCCVHLVGLVDGKLAAHSEYDKVFEQFINTDTP